MCTLVILRRPGHAWPVLIGANRDEMIDRESKPPGRHWPDRPEVVAGLDVLAGGSWLGVNDWGVVAAVLNRHGSLGPEANRRSRGELVLEALDHADAAAAAEALSHLNPGAYRTFNLIVADESNAFWLRHAGGRRIELKPVKDGFSMIAAGDIDDLTTRRIQLALPAFRAWPVPDPDGYGTRSSALVALPPRDATDRTPIFRFAEWLPHQSPWCHVMVADRGSRT